MRVERKTTITNKFSIEKIKEGRLAINIPTPPHVNVRVNGLLRLLSLDSLVIASCLQIFDHPSLFYPQSISRGMQNIDIYPYIHMCVWLYLYVHIYIYIYTSPCSYKSMHIYINQCRDRSKRTLQIINSFISK